MDSRHCVEASTGTSARTGVSHARPAPPRNGLPPTRAHPWTKSAPWGGAIPLESSSRPRPAATFACLNLTPEQDLRRCGGCNQVGYGPLPYEVGTPVSCHKAHWKKGRHKRVHAVWAKGGTCRGSGGGSGGGGGGDRKGGGAGGSTKPKRKGTTGTTGKKNRRR